MRTAIVCQRTECPSCRQSHPLCLPTSVPYSHHRTRGSQMALHSRRWESKQTFSAWGSSGAFQVSCPIFKRYARCSHEQNETRRIRMARASLGGSHSSCGRSKSSRARQRLPSGKASSLCLSQVSAIPRCPMMFAQCLCVCFFSLLSFSFPV